MAELSPEFDPRSPYYVDPDFPDYEPDVNLPMVKFSEAYDNYFTWKEEFLKFLLSKNKTAFVDGTVVKPEPSSPLYEPWKVCNARVKWWMRSSVSEDVKYRFAETAQEAWEDLRKIFVPNVDSKIYALRQRIAMLRQDGDSVWSYFRKFKSAWMELWEYDPLPECACGGCGCEIKKRAEEARKKEQRYAFLMGSDEEVPQIMIMNPPLSLDQAYSVVSRAESSRMNSTR